jgi:hypothetical protein
MSEENSTLVIPDIKYNQPDFDLEHYPLQDCHKKFIAEIDRYFQDRLPKVRSWLYDVTSQGRIFSVPYIPHRLDLMQRLTIDDMKFLVGLPGLRWVECRQDQIAFGIKHNF